MSGCIHLASVIRMVLISLFVCTLSACAGTANKSQYSVMSGGSCIMQPGVDYGAVCFFREDAFEGSLVAYYVREGDEAIGALPVGAYFMIKAKPGKHTYWAETEDPDRVMVDVEAGKTNYVRFTLREGLFLKVPKLDEIDARFAVNILPELQCTELK